MALRYTDYNGHDVPDTNGAALASGSNGTSAAGTVVPVNAGAGSGSAVSAVVGNDRRGSFTLTAAGTPAAGKVASVYFAQPYSTPPAAVIVTAQNATDSTAPITISASLPTVAGFDIYSSVLTAAKAYTIQYSVIA